MITDTCPLCGSEFSYDDPRQMHTIWDLQVEGWVPICDECADGA